MAKINKLGGLGCTRSKNRAIKYVGLSIRMSNRFSKSNKNIGRKENIQKKKKSPNSHKSLKKMKNVFVYLITRKNL